MSVRLSPDSRPRAAEATGPGKGRSSKAGGGGSTASSGEQLPSADLLVKAVLLYPEAVVRLQVRCQVVCQALGLGASS